MNVVHHSFEPHAWQHEPHLYSPSQQIIMSGTVRLNRRVWPARWEAMQLNHRPFRHVNMWYCCDGDRLLSCLNVRMYIKCTNLTMMHHHHHRSMSQWRFYTWFDSNSHVTKPRMMHARVLDAVPRNRFLLLILFVWCGFSRSLCLLSRIFRLKFCYYCANWVNGTRSLPSLIRFDFFFSSWELSFFF